jgi:hypothetical protein
MILLINNLCFGRSAKFQSYVFIKLCVRVYVAWTNHRTGNLEWLEVLIVNGFDSGKHYW